ncbi:MAG: HisS family protein, partial [bacterium]|nr:HisS family protein [bacterium]
MAKDNFQTLKGFRDFLPAGAAARQEVFTKIRTVLEQYGFLPLETPALEYKEILSGKYGKEGEKLMYSFADQGGRGVAMRYDLTVPLARVVAQYQNELAMPFKRYQIAPVWRADRPQKGRYREFTQCDIDVVGSSSIFVDAEVIVCLYNALTALGIEDVVVRINNRKFLDGLLKASGIAAKKTVEVLRILDKLE